MAIKHRCVDCVYCKRFEEPKFKTEETKKMAKTIVCRKTRIEKPDTNSQFCKSYAEACEAKKYRNRHGWWDND